MALYDLVAKMDEKPLYVMLNGDRSKKIYTDNTVSLLTKEKMVEKALKFKEMGFPVLKVKLGERGYKKDVARMEAIVKFFRGSNSKIRECVKCGWLYDDEYPHTCQ